MICPTCGKAQLTERPHIHPSARRSASVPERCAKCGSTDLYRDYHEATTCAPECRRCHRCERTGVKDTQDLGRGEHFSRSCRGCHYKWMEPAPLVIEEPTE